VLGFRWGFSEFEECWLGKVTVVWALARKDPTLSARQPVGKA